MHLRTLKTMSTYWVSYWVWLEGMAFEIPLSSSLIEQNYIRNIKILNTNKLSDLTVMGDFLTTLRTILKWWGSAIFSGHRVPHWLHTVTFDQGVGKGWTGSQHKACMGYPWTPQSQKPVFPQLQQKATGIKPNGVQQKGFNNQRSKISYKKRPFIFKKLENVYRSLD